MEARGTRQRPSSDWLHPPVESEGVGRYVETVRERIWVVVAAVAITTGVAILYVLSATKQYEAQADLLVTPTAAADSALVSLPLVRQSSDPTRDVETVSRLTANVDVAERVIDKLGLEIAPQDLLDDVTAEPIAQSSIVSVVATAATPAGARDLANAFAEQAVAVQTAKLHQSIDRLLPVLKARAENESTVAAADPNSATAAVAALETLRSAPDPTLRVETEARLPDTPASPRPALSVAAGLIAGMVLGLGGAFAAQALDPRLRREEQLRRLYNLPILARIPTDKRRRGKPLSPFQLSPPTAEAFRTLRGTLVLGRVKGRARSGSRVILVTGSSPEEGKTTTAVNLAASLAATGAEVILVEADLRRPAVSKALDVTARHGLVSVLLESLELDDALVENPSLGNLKLLLADYDQGSIAELFALPAARELVDQARQAADYVIIDSPPLADVIDALPLASYADDVLIVSRIRRTDLRKLSRLGELLAETGITPAGFAVVGTARPKRSEYHYYTAKRPRIAREPTPRDADVAGEHPGEGGASDDAVEAQARPG